MSLNRHLKSFMNPTLDVSNLTQVLARHTSDRQTQESEIQWKQNYRTWYNFEPTFVLLCQISPHNVLMFLNYRTRTVTNITREI